MQSYAAIAFCVFLGIAIHEKGWWSLLWFPAGFVFGLYLSSQIFLPITMGIPTAARLIIKKSIKPAVVFHLILFSFAWTAAILVIGVVIGIIWPKSLSLFENNVWLNFGLDLGFISILLTPFSAKYRSDFKEDFDNRYASFYVHKETKKPIVTAADDVGW